MIHHSCCDCQRGFVAASRGEAYEEYLKLFEGQPTLPSFEGAVKMNEVAYAKCCPYCGGTNIEVT